MVVRRGMANRARGAKTPKTPAGKAPASESSYPFPYLGHGLGSASNDLVIHAVFERDPAKIPKKTFDPFPVARAGRCMTVYVPDKQLSYAVGADPDFDDAPSSLADEKMYEAYEVERQKLKENAQHLLAYVHGLDLWLRRAHALVPTVACARLQGSRAKFTRWHTESLRCLPEIFDHVAATLADSKRFPSDYADTNHYGSKARVFWDFYASILRTRKDLEKLGDDQRRQLAAKVAVGVGYSPVTDNFFIATLMLLKGITQQAAMRELCSEHPPEMLQALQEMNDNWPPAERFD